MERKQLIGAPSRARRTREDADEAIRFSTSQGVVVLEAAPEQLAELICVAARCLEASREVDEIDTSPALPVRQWETGVAAHDRIALRLRLAGGGEFIFMMSAALATSLQAGLGETLASPAANLCRPH